MIEEIDFGFFFCRVASFYHLGYEGTMRLPIKTFWTMLKNIDRIEAKLDQRSLALGLVAQSTPETVKTFRQELVLEAGTIVRMEDEVNPLAAKRDEAGFAELKRMAGQQIG